MQLIDGKATSEIIKDEIRDAAGGSPQAFRGLRRGWEEGPSDTAAP